MTTIPRRTTSFRRGKRLHRCNRHDRRPPKHLTPAQACWAMLPKLRSVDSVYLPLQRCLSGGRDPRMNDSAKAVQHRLNKKNPPQESTDLQPLHRTRPQAFLSADRSLPTAIRIRGKRPQYLHPSLLSQDRLEAPADSGSLPKSWFQSDVQIDRSQELGHGAFGQVYVGTLRNATRVAVKMVINDLDELAVQSFIREAQTWEGLGQRNGKQRCCFDFVQQLTAKNTRFCSPAPSGILCFSTDAHNRFD